MAKSRRKSRGRRKDGPTVAFLSGDDWEAHVQTVKDAIEELDDRLTEAASRVEGAQHVGCKGDELEAAAQEFLDDEDLQSLLDELESAVGTLVEGARVGESADGDDE